MKYGTIVGASIIALGMIISAGIVAVTFHHSAPPREATAHPVIAPPQPLLAADEPLVAGDVLEISISDLVKEGEVSTRYCRVGKDGNIRLWFVDNVSAAGMGSGQLEQMIIKAFHDKQIIPHATVSATAWRP